MASGDERKIFHPLHDEHDQALGKAVWHVHDCHDAALRFVMAAQIRDFPGQALRMDFVLECDPKSDPLSGYNCLGRGTGDWIAAVKPNPPTSSLVS